MPLLLSLDRLQSNELAMTQELIANMRGVRREGVTESADHLHHAGSSTTIAAISLWSTVSDSNGALSRCYAVVKNAYDRLFPVMTI